MTTITVELLPCPFCGGKAHATPENRSIRMPERVMCLTCAVELDGPGAIEQWNRRALLSEQPQAGAGQSAPAVPVAWRLRNTAYRTTRYEYFENKESAERRAFDFNRSVDDGGLYDLTPLYMAARADSEQCERGVLASQRDIYMNEVAALQRKVAAMRSEVAARHDQGDEVLRDAKRYRWIAENADVDCRGHAPDGDYASLGERIDAALTQPPKGEEE